MKRVLFLAVTMVAFWSTPAFAQFCDDDTDCAIDDICVEGECILDDGGTSTPGGDPVFVDIDDDGIADEFDPNIGSDDTLDSDGDGFYDWADPEPFVFNDFDGNGVGDGFQDFDGDGTADFIEYIHDGGDGAMDIPGYDETIYFDDHDHTVVGSDDRNRTEIVCSASPMSTGGSGIPVIFLLLLFAGFAIRRMRHDSI